ncbi:esterase/lipase family protein, partial [Xanthomonas bromi]
AKKGQRIWNIDSMTSLVTADNSISWPGQDAAARQLLLNMDAVEVDDGGPIELRREESFVYLPDEGRSADRKREEIRQARLDDKRRRGWGTVSWYSYGPFLNWLEEHLAGATYRNGKPSMTFLELLQQVGTSPTGAIHAPPPLTEEQIKKLVKFRFPVHAVGYNWLKSNLDSGQYLADKIAAIRKHYTDLGMDCQKVIVITHSMGGLVARAASQACGADKDILAVIHGVMPTDGAGAFYKRFVGGFAGEGEGILGGLIGKVTALVLGVSGRETTPVLGFGPGPMELAPNQFYNGGKPWLFIKDAHGKTLLSLPERGNPYEEIYRANPWWQAVNPAWLNPAGLPFNPLLIHRQAMKKAESYHKQLAQKFHQPTYAYWGNDAADHKAWGSVTWRAVVANVYDPDPGDFFFGDKPPKRTWLERPGKAIAGHPAQWHWSSGHDDLPANEALPERYLLDEDGQTLRCTLEAPADAGDGTVPAAHSGAGVMRGSPAVACRTMGYDHQMSYNNDSVRAFVFDSVVRAIAPLVVTA